MRDNPSQFPNPARLLKKIGITDRLSGLAIIGVAALQYLFLVKLWEGYLIRHIGVFVHPVVVWSGLILSFLGTCLLYTSDAADE